MLLLMINASAPRVHGMVLVLLLPPSLPLLPISLLSEAAAASPTTPKLICLKLCGLNPGLYQPSCGLWKWTDGVEEYATIEERKMKWFLNKLEFVLSFEKWREGDFKRQGRQRRAFLVWIKMLTMRFKSMFASHTQNCCQVMRICVRD